MRDSVFLQSKVRILGSGTDSVLFKEPSATSRLIADGDHWHQEVTLADPRGFRVGDGVRLIAKDPYGKGTNLIQRTLVASAGNRFKLDRRLEERFHLEGDPQIATNFSLLQCTGVTDVTVENITVDGNKAHNEMIDKGVFDDGCIRLDDCNRIRSQRSIVRGNRVQRSREGIYFCWGAQHGLYEKNAIEDCEYGMTLGHRDSDNLIRDNDVRRSGKAGIHFRGGSKAFAPHRNRFERNRIVDSGGEKGVAIDINGETESVTVIRNELRETRAPLSRIGILIGAETRDIRCAANRIEGFAIPISDSRKG
jgi:hypothetical protein